MSSLSRLASALLASPSLQQSFNTTQLLLFIGLCCHLRQELAYTPSNSPHLPPLHLPGNIQQFLALCLFSNNSAIEISLIEDAWKALNRIIWEAADRVASPSTLTDNSQRE